MEVAASGSDYATEFESGSPSSSMGAGGSAARRLPNTERAPGRGAFGIGCGE
jgi:hypothetical protein